MHGKQPGGRPAFGRPVSRPKVVYAMAPRRFTSRSLKAASPWLIGIVGIVGIALVALEYVRPEGTGPAAIRQGQPVERAFSPSPGTSVSPARPSPPSLGVPEGPRGRPDPFAPLVSSEGRPPGRFPSPAAVPLPPPPGGTLGAPAFVQPGAGMTVTGIIGGRSRVAIVQREEGSYVVGVGDRVGDAVVVAISADQIVLKQRHSTFTLVLPPTGTVFSEAGEATPPPCIPASSQGAAGASPGQPAASAPTPPAPTGGPGAPPSEPSSTSAAPSQPAGGAGGPSVSYAPGVPPGVTEPKPNTGLVGVQSPSPSGGDSGGPSVSYAPGVAPGVTAPKPNTALVGVQSPTPGGSPSPAAAPSQPAGGASSEPPTAAPGSPPGGSVSTPAAPSRGPGLRPRVLPPC